MKLAGNDILIQSLIERELNIFLVIQAVQLFIYMTQFLSKKKWNTFLLDMNKALLMLLMVTQEQQESLE